MALCSHRIVLPGSPSTCALDTILVPLPSFLLVVAFLLLLSRLSKHLENVNRLPYPHWLHNVYFVLVLAAFAMTILEMARLSAQDLGVGLLPMSTTALFIVMVALWIERGRIWALSIILCSYWLFLAAMETVKVVRLNVLDETIPNKASSPEYPASDQLLDNAVMVALYWLFFVFELYTITTIIRKRQVDKTDSLLMLGIQ
ncbi:hypothetical protein J3R30DRAFT_3378163 [Lentinula aciculospora]|uniref:ABC transporter TMD0 domain-containing protein n=1 Tax=Lentinula aciculospora TaxID=153920 RepID=A0A9W9A3L8_9AGAR|nr:hypothetical protein J3R30DRAFT_3378163 [Lentinula aciculospora]